MPVPTCVRLSLVAALLVGCTGSGDRQQPPLGSDVEIEVVATWTGVEQARFERVLDQFRRRTGVDADYTPVGHSLPARLTTRLAAGTAPDVAFLPQPALLRELAAAGALVPLDATTQELVDEHYADAFRDLASWQGRLYGVWFKVADKSLVWYDVGSFEQVGAVPPHDLADLLDLARRLAARGVPAFAVSARDGWTLTDWFENVLLRVAGPEAYDALATGHLAWTAAPVRESLELLLRLLDPAHVLGGTDGALDATFEQSVEQLAAGRAAMVVEGDFVAGVLSRERGAQLGVDVDAFPFPRGADLPRAAVGGGDVAVLLRPSPAGAALLRFLAGPEAAATWAASGGFLSPNLDLDLAVYPDDLTRDAARRLLEAGDGFRFDLSDLLPSEVGGQEQQGLRAELRELLVHRDVARTTARLQAATAGS